MTSYSGDTRRTGEGRGGAVKTSLSRVTQLRTSKLTLPKNNNIYIFLFCYPVQCKYTYFVLLFKRQKTLNKAIPCWAARPRLGKIGEYPPGGVVGVTIDRYSVETAVQASNQAVKTGYSCLD